MGIDFCETTSEILCVRQKRFGASQAPHPKLGTPTPKMGTRKPKLETFFFFEPLNPEPYTRALVVDDRERPVVRVQGAGVGCRVHEALALRPPHPKIW